MIEDYPYITYKKNLKMNLYNPKNLYDRGKEQEIRRSNLSKTLNATSN